MLIPNLSFNLLHPVTTVLIRFLTLGSHSVSKFTILKNALSFIQSLEEQLFTLKQRLAQLRIKTESLVVIANDHTDDSESQILYGCVDNRDAFQTLKLTQLFCTFLEYLFVSFSDVIDLSNIEFKSFYSSLD